MRARAMRVVPQTTVASPDEGIAAFSEAPQATPRVAILKLGGDCLETEEQRDLAVTRILEMRAKGIAALVVCSPIGGRPNPYSSEALLELLNSPRRDPNTDLLLATASMISSAVVASMLVARGAPALALLGSQAGIVTDDEFGEATIRRIEPTNLNELLLAGTIPVIAGFQGITESGQITTLGRGGGDLVALSLGHALHADVTIYSNADGVVTTDPTDTGGVATLGQINHAELAEIASDEKPVSTKAAEYARATETPYQIRGLRSNAGTTVRQQVYVDGRHPVLGVAAKRNLTFVHVALASGSGQMRLDPRTELLRRIALRRIPLEFISLSGSGLALAIDTSFARAAKKEIDDLRLTSRILPGCAALSIIGSTLKRNSGVVHRIVRALRSIGIDIVHATNSNIAVSVVVREEDVTPAEQALHDEFRYTCSNPFETIYYDEAQGIVEVRGNRYKLGRTQNRLLRLLIENAGRTVSYEEAAGALFECTTHEAISALRVHVHNLRKKIESDPNAPQHIITVVDKGYCFSQ